VETSTFILNGEIMEEQLKNISGIVTITRYNNAMEVVETHTFKNLVVQTGLNWIAARCNNPVPDVMDYIAVGTDNTIPALNQTALVAELVRVAVNPSGGAVSNNQLAFNTILGAGVGTGGLQEAGIFDASTGGAMLSRVTYPIINKGASDTVAISWTITFG
jgi:Phage tail-collar fibre protein